MSDDKGVRIQEALTELFHDKHRVTYTTSEVMEQVGIDADRRIYIDTLRDTTSIRESNLSNSKGNFSPCYWIFGRLDIFETLEQRVSKLENDS